MKGNFEACLKETLRHEGGWSDHPQDRGGATMKGVTIGVYAQWKGRKVTKDELRAISDAEVAAIYRRNYWDKVRGDELPRGLDLVAFDAAVNSGPTRSAKWLQSSVGAAADGKIGPDTIHAASRAPIKASIMVACETRRRFLRGLREWPTFGKGWMRRVADVEAAALRMAEAAVDAPAAPAPQTAPISQPQGRYVDSHIGPPRPGTSFSPREGWLVSLFRAVWAAISKRKY